ncbi:uncharacterized protein LOC104893324 [Beta vulgaris subsp. vulgaris]|uniref:uncharacterized protein LOC104893324 n=1 Tax=Beta vulgaris subsp. vulgaris TaxID=3555 RepID=UPI00053F6689|nr:uncharacterized protein LOC104893324 [Beta vulgaris subsp. vulgaris]
MTSYCKNRCEYQWKKGRFGECNCISKRKCKFRVYAKQLRGEGGTVQIKSMDLAHRCDYQSHNRKVTYAYLADKYLKDWRDNPTWKLSAFMLKCRRDLGVEGDAAEQYKRVWDYGATVRKYNEGSNAVVKCERIERPPPLFQRMYICLQPYKEGFMDRCKPILGVDGCHLRGPYPGILLTAVGKDGNNNIFPVVWWIPDFLQIYRLEARAKPILTMMEWIRRWVMKRCCQKREGLLKFEGLIMPSVVKMVEKQKEYIRNCDVNQADVWESEVDHTGDTFVVDLEKKKCGCFRWELMGIPCCPVLACIEKKRLNYEDYVHEAY